jgi:hypothetical protein
MRHQFFEVRGSNGIAKSNDFRPQDNAQPLPLPLPSPLILALAGAVPRPAVRRLGGWFGSGEGSLDEGLRPRRTAELAASLLGVVVGFKCADDIHPRHSNVIWVELRRIGSAVVFERFDSA